MFALHLRETIAAKPTDPNLQFERDIKPPSVWSISDEIEMSPRRRTVSRNENPD